ncbi:hypothetical protein TVAG_288970 [Trichomonas vaginalis G3]|uniref:Uncharacterized protein n=1 Tax=Trichomonas vaginalis (strain ATCC PRA-98 / G3) TaxID=412133 RepID=A2ERF2_TRIV3|nr:hypothetical protein TVAGG3_0127630 [Trichomonas vaginalis G3]EAY04755.1 hypothetical protein TVAG_288970 [Trichomonas vaginalis G3]KAI5545875.1 hypothetical protein TVAGG3_0127630 [Trichomonas vaginalis G3]|eukprot:XP_001316978.1 hypothetical protein [Trichomonas vaginalis G3]
MFLSLILYTAFDYSNQRDDFSSRIVSDYQTDYEYSDFEESSYYEYSDENEESSYDEIMAESHHKFSNRNDSDHDGETISNDINEPVYYYNDYFFDDLERNDNNAKADKL